MLEDEIGGKLKKNKGGGGRRRERLRGAESEF